MYKIVAKMLANRLVTVLGDLVNEIQYAFVADRQILNGPFVLNEVVQWCKNRKKQIMMFKVDFEKAYDSVRWEFVDNVLKKFGFGEKWCLWIRSCLQSSRGSVLVNSSPTVVDASLFRGIKIGSSIQLSHLFYADDAIFMGNWSQSNISTIIRVLDVFHRASGLHINMNKSKMLGISVDNNLVEQAAAKIGCAILVHKVTERCCLDVVLCQKLVKGAAWCRKLLKGAVWMLFLCKKLLKGVVRMLFMAVIGCC
nr:RNA-directed DNA polymerase, eukaryota [Tanacetum cinerariifolium]